MLDERGKFQGNKLFEGIKGWVVMGLSGGMVPLSLSNLSPSANIQHDLPFFLQLLFYTRENGYWNELSCKRVNVMSYNYKQTI